MVAKTYYSKITTGITLFTGYTTNIPTSGSGAAPAKDELTASIVPLSTGYPSGSSIKMFSKVSGIGVGQWAKSYTASSLISGVTFHGYVRGGATKSFWMKSYTSAGALHQSGSATAVLGPSTDSQAHIVFTGQSVTVPAGGALVISVDYSGTGRMYIGMNPKGNGDPNFPDSMVVVLDEVPAGGGATTADGAPSISAVTASGASEVKRTADGSPSITKPTAAGTGADIHLSDGSPSITAIEAAGTGAVSSTQTADGAPSITKPVADGTSKVVRTADGSPSITKPVADGVSEVIHSSDGSPSITKPVADGVSEVTRISDGAPSITKPTAAGVSEIARAASGSPEITKPTATGTGSVAAGGPGQTADGSPSISNVTASGLGVLERIATGGPSLTKFTAAGNSFIWPKVYLNTTETLSGATEMSIVSVEPDGTGITFNDSVGAPTGSLFLGVENRANGDVGWIPVTVTVATGPTVLFGSFGA